VYTNVKKIGNFAVIDVGKFKVVVTESDYTSFINSVKVLGKTNMDIVGTTVSPTADVQVLIDARGKPSVGFYSALVVQNYDQVLEIVKNPKLFDLFSDYVPLHSINKVNLALSSRVQLLRTKYKEYRSARRRAGIPL